MNMYIHTYMYNTNKYRNKETTKAKKFTCISSWYWFHDCTLWLSSKQSSFKLDLSQFNTVSAALADHGCRSSGAAGNLFFFFL